MDTLYYITRDGEQQGPYTVAQLRSMWQSGSVTAHTQYWFEGAASWQPLIRIRTLLEGVSVAPSPANLPRAKATVRHARIPSETSDRRILPALLLWFFLGGFAAHRFYAGRIESALWLLGLFLSGIILLIFASGAAAALALPFLLSAGVWTFIDLIAIVTGNLLDSENRPITQWT